MESILDWGVKVILWFQNFSPTLDLPFKALTYMGEEVFFMLIIPLLYWCLERRTGIRLTILFLLSAYVNAVVKEIMAQPRPFQYDLRVQQLVEAAGEGFPSGHTQHAVVLWGYLASRSPYVWAWVVAGVLMVLIPLSRVYLGVHFPTDLLGGYFLGGILLTLYLLLEPGAEAWLRKKGLSFQLGAALALPVLLMIVLPTGGPYGVSAGSLLVGMGLGFALERRWVGFESGGLWWKRVLRYLLGITVIFMLWLGLRVTFSGLDPELLYRSVRYGLAGLWGGLGAPWAFVKLQLAETRASAGEPRCLPSKK